MSVACWNSGGRDSRHSSRPKRKGELAPTAICTAATACAAFHTSANRSGVTCRCNCTEVQAASGAIEAEVHDQPLHTLDVEDEVLAAGGHGSGR